MIAFSFHCLIFQLFPLDRYTLPSSSSSSEDIPSPNKRARRQLSDEESESDQDFCAEAKNFEEFSLLMPFKRHREMVRVASSKRQLGYLVRYVRENLSAEKGYHFVVDTILARDIQPEFYWTGPRVSSQRHGGTGIPRAICKKLEKLFKIYYAKIPSDLAPEELEAHMVKQVDELRAKIRNKLNGLRQYQKHKN